MVIVAQRLDVAEELDRLDAHLAEIGAVLQRPEPVGRRLDFLTQELNREANTLASKSSDAETTRATVELKVLIEQIRNRFRISNEARPMSAQGILYIVSAPSGAARKPVCLTDSWPSPPVWSCRFPTPPAPPRPGEQDGVDYHFNRSPPLSAPAGAGSVIRARRGLRPLLRHRTPNGAGPPGGGRRRDPGNRLAGRPPGAGAAPRQAAAIFIVPPAGKRCAKGCGTGARTPPP